MKLISSINEDCKIEEKCQLTEAIKKVYKSPIEKFWTNTPYTECTTDKMHAGLLWCLGYYVYNYISKESIEKIESVFEENIFYTCSKIYQLRNTPEYEELFKQMPDIFEIIKSAIEKVIIIEDENSVSFKEDIYFCAIPDKGKVKFCTREPSGFKFKQVTGITILQNKKLKDLELWFPESADKATIDIEAMDLHSFHKILKRCRKIIIEYNVKPFPGNVKPFPVLWALKVEGLQSFLFRFNLNPKAQEMIEIVNKYIPKGNVYDCQDELINAGFEEYAQL